MKKRALLIGGINAIPLGQGVVSLMMREYNLRLFIASSTRRSEREDGVERFYGDINRYEDILNAILGCDIVVVCYKSSSQQMPIIESGNIDRAIKESGVTNVVYISEHNNRSSRFKDDF